MYTKDNIGPNIYRNNFTIRKFYYIIKCKYAVAKTQKRNWQHIPNSNWPSLGVVSASRIYYPDGVSPPCNM